MPEAKEPHFFSTDDGKPPLIAATDKAAIGEIIWNFNNYVGLFDDAREDQLLGEASTGYLTNSDKTIKNIKKHVPSWQHLRIIIMLRNPIERAFSHYSMMKLIGLENLEFDEALSKEGERRKNNCPWSGYIQGGRYYENVKAYLNIFPHTKIILFEDLKENALGLVKDLYVFLGIESSFLPNVGEKHNPSGEPRSTFLHRLFMTPNIISSKIPLVKLIPLEIRGNIVKKLKLKNLKKSEMKEETRQFLKNLYSEDILKLQDLVGRDLSAWLE